MQGVAAIEFAIVLIPLMIMAFGVVEYGRALYQYNTLAKAVRDGARLLSQNSPTDPGYANIQEDARCLIVFGNPACEGPPLVPDLTVAQVIICDRVQADGCTEAFANVTTGFGLVNLVEVRVAGYQHTYIGLPFLPNAATVTFNAIRVTMRQII